MKKLLNVLLGIVFFLTFYQLSLAQGPAPLTNDVFPGWGTNSEYMIGDVAVGIVFVESDGTIDTQTENWTAQEKSAVTAEIEAGLAWWTVREARADLTFTTEYSHVDTGYEAINRSPNGYWLWVPETLEAMGYSGTEAFNYTDDYNNDLIDRFETDWAFTIFVVDSSADADGTFFDSDIFAFAFRGGPLVVMTYDNGNWGISLMEQVTAHEVGHIFGAMDQTGTDCEATSGYLNIPNHNSSECPWPTHASIMRFAPAAYPWGLVDRYARGQVGWWDWNCNGVLDPIDPDVGTDYCFYIYLPIILKDF